MKPSNKFKTWDGSSLMWCGKQSCWGMYVHCTSLLTLLLPSWSRPTENKLLLHHQNLGNLRTMLFSSPLHLDCSLLKVGLLNIKILKMLVLWTKLMCNKCGRESLVGTVWLVSAKKKNRNQTIGIQISVRDMLESNQCEAGLYDTKVSLSKVTLDSQFCCFKSKPTSKSVIYLWLRFYYFWYDLWNAI